MPELPEVHALATTLNERLLGAVVAGVNMAAISVLKTVDPEPRAMHGLRVTAVTRKGKFLVTSCDGIHLVVHLARAGWIRWADQQSPAPLRPGKGPIALRVRFAGVAGRDVDDDVTSGLDVTEAGTKKSVAAYVVRDPHDVPGIARLGVDPLSDDLTAERLGEILGNQPHHIKGVLRDQSVFSGIGNAYSDEILHAAGLSPFAMANALKDQQTEHLHRAIHDVLSAAIARSAGKPFHQLKDSKRRGMAVHGRTGEQCGTCTDVVREVSFADSSLQYCATCQTGGKPLADRRMSRLLK